MVPVVQLVRASDCGSECRGFESHRAPERVSKALLSKLFFLYIIYYVALYIQIKNAFCPYEGRNA